MLLQQFMGEKFGRDNIWETHLAEELWNTEVELDVVLDEQTMRLSDVMALQPGDRIMLNTALGAPVLAALRRGAAVRGPRRPPQEPRRGAHRARRCRGCSRPSDSADATAVSGFLTLPRDNGRMEWILELALVAPAGGDPVPRRAPGTRARRAETRSRAAAGADRRLQRQHASGGSRHRAAARRRGRRRAADRAAGRCRAVAEGRSDAADRARRAAGRPAGRAGARRHGRSPARRRA